MSRFFGGLNLVIGTFFGKTLAVFAPAHLVTLSPSLSVCLSSAVCLFVVKCG